MVIVIIGILAGVIMISTSSSIDKANIAKSKVFEESVQNNLAANMVSAWDADHVTKGTTWILNDKWGSNNGTFYDNTSTACTTSLCPQITTDNQMGNVLSFDGINDHVIYGNDTSLWMKTGSQTISFWVKFDNALAPQYETLLVCGAANSGAEDGYWIRRELGTNRLYVTFGDGLVSVRLEGYLSGAGSLTNNTWYNIVTVFDRTSNTYAYINGIKQFYNLDISSRRGDIQNYYSLQTGTYSGAGHPFDGSFNNLKIYNTVLSSLKIKQNYIAGINSLLSKGQISKEEYNSKLSNLAKTND